MKKINGIVIATLVFYSVGYSHIEIMEEKTIGKTEIKNYLNKWLTRAV